MEHPAAIYERREAEYAATKTAAEVDELQRRWTREDRAREAAADWRNQELVALRVRVARLERIDKRDLHFRGTRKDFDQFIAAVVAEELAKHEAPVVYKGAWTTGTSYPAGALVTRNGAGWIALSAVGPDVRPGDPDTAWRLAVKSDTAELRAAVKGEVTRQLTAKPGVA